MLALDFIAPVRSGPWRALLVAMGQLRGSLLPPARKPALQGLCASAVLRHPRNAQLETGQQQVLRCAPCVMQAATELLVDSLPLPALALALLGLCAPLVLRHPRNAQLANGQQQVLRCAPYAMQVATELLVGSLLLLALALALQAHVNVV